MEMERLGTMDYKATEERARFIRERYSGLRKGQKSELLSRLNRLYGLKKYTMVTKFAGKGRFTALEVAAIYDLFIKSYGNGDEG